jgi:hypothetical protein
MFYKEVNECPHVSEDGYLWRKARVSYAVGQRSLDDMIWEIEDALKQIDAIGRIEEIVTVYKHGRQR